MHNPLIKTLEPLSAEALEPLIAEALELSSPGAPQPKFLEPSPVKGLELLPSPGTPSSYSPGIPPSGALNPPPLGEPYKSVVSLSGKAVRIRLIWQTNVRATTYTADTAAKTHHCMVAQLFINYVLSPK
jgi:hypothetical protein